MIYCIKNDIMSIGGSDFQRELRVIDGNRKEIWKDIQHSKRKILFNTNFEFEQTNRYSTYLYFLLKYIILVESGNKFPWRKVIRLLNNYSLQNH